MTETPSTSVPSEAGLDPAAERRQRSLSTRPRDMLISMAVIVGIVIVMLLIVPRPNKIPEREINVASAALAARSQLGFSPADPQLSGDWTPRAAGVQTDTTDGLAAWHLTFTTPSGTYAGVEQAKKATKAWESRQVTDGQEAGVKSIDGKDWIVRSRLDRGITNLVYRSGNGITTVVSGTADQAQMEEFAAAVGSDLK